jgi:hypothetical protein
LVLLLVIALAWLTVVTLVVTVCQAAARGDAAARDEDRVLEPICDGLVAWDRAAAASLRSRWLTARDRGGRAHAPVAGAASMSGRRSAVTPRR